MEYSNLRRKTWLKGATGISTASIVTLGKGGNITTDVFLKICETLNCKVEDIMETVVDKEETAKPDTEQ